MLYGYCRISTKKQSIDRQIRNIKAAYPEAIIVQEVFTGTKQSRPEWNKLYKKLKSKDIVVFDSVSRMSRNADEGFCLYQELYKAGIDLVFLKEPHINTATYKQAVENQINISMESGDKATDDLMSAVIEALNKYILTLAGRQIRLAFEQSEKEVTDLRQRTKEGMETARLNGKQIGQAEGKKLVTKKSVQTKAIIKKYSKTFGGSLTDKECIKFAGVQPNSYYKYKKELLQEDDKA